MSSYQRLAEYQIEQVKGYILSECLHLGDFTLSSGEKSNYYVNCVPLYSTVVIRNQLAKGLHFMAMHSLKNKKVRQPVSYLGMETRGIPLAMCAAYHAGVLFGILRKEQKVYGMNRIIEHYDKFVQGVLFDDVITTGKTIEKSLAVIKDIARVYSIICIANRNNIKEIDGIPVYSLLGYDELNRMILSRIEHKNIYDKT
jgi:orotate phosphoribosyltransferase